MSNKQGMNWIAKDKRLAIYIRDGMACAYCGSGLEEGAQLTLDHLTPRSQGGTHSETNLVTCCQKCNSVRGDRDLVEFVQAAATYINHGVTAEMIINGISQLTARNLTTYRNMAKEILANRPNWKLALAEAVK